MLRLLFVFLPLLFKTFLYAGKTDLLVCFLGGLEALAPTGKSDPLSYKVLRDPLRYSATVSHRRSRHGRFCRGWVAVVVLVVFVPWGHGSRRNY